MQFTFLCELCTTRCRNFKGLQFMADQRRQNRFEITLKSMIKSSSFTGVVVDCCFFRQSQKSNRHVDPNDCLGIYEFSTLHYIENPHFYFSAIYLSTSLHHDAFKTDKWAKATWRGLFEHYCYSKVLYVYTFNVYNLCMNV